MYFFRQLDGASRWCIFDLRIEVYTEFQSRKHILLLFGITLIFKTLGSKMGSDLKPCHTYINHMVSVERVKHT